MEMPSVRSEVKSFLLVMFWVIFALGVFDRFPLPGFAAKLYLVALAGVVTMSAYGFGAWPVARCLTEEDSAIEFVLFSTIVGFGLLSLVMAAAGAAALWTRGGAILIISAGLLSAWSRRLTLSRLVKSDFKEKFATVPLFLIAVGAILSLALTFTLISRSKSSSEVSSTFPTSGIPALFTRISSDP